MSSKKKSRAPQAATASRARRQFEALAPVFHAASTLARAWRQAESEAGELATRELAPLSDAYDRGLKKLVLMLDEKHGNPGLDETERATLSDFLVDAALDLLEHDKDARLDEIFDRHSGSDGLFDDDEERDAAFPSEFRNVPGEAVDTEIDADIDEDIDFDSPEGRDLMRSLIEEDEAVWEARESRLEAKLEKIEEEARRHEALLRETIAGIVGELGDGPDATPGLDEAGRRPGAELVHRARAAAQEEDLLSLLELRLELERQGMVGHFSEKRLSACNKLLQEELRILEMENHWHARHLAARLGDTAPALLTPSLLVDELNADIAETRGRLAVIERELSELQDLEKLKTWLRETEESDEP